MRTSNRSGCRHCPRKCRRNHLEPPYTDPYVRWCGRGRRVTAAPMPIKSAWDGTIARPRRIAGWTARIERIGRSRTGILYNTDWGCVMPRETTYTSLRENLASVLDEVVDQQDVVIVRRRGARDVALLPATELSGLLETAHLLRSPRNARRLLGALRRAERGKTKPGTLLELRREILGEARV